MTAERGRSRRAIMLSSRDRRARLHGLAYLVVAAGLAFAHDAIAGLPASAVVRGAEQITLASALVLGLLGGLLLVDGRRAFDPAYADAARRREKKADGRSASSRRSIVRRGSPASSAKVDDGSAFDSRSGAAMARARHVIAVVQNGDHHDRSASDR